MPIAVASRQSSVPAPPHRHPRLGLLRLAFLFGAVLCSALLVSLAFCDAALAHGIRGADAAYVVGTRGAHLIPFFYLGAKHMVTGYDHLLFLFSVIFFLYRLSEIALYVTLFSLGHSITLLIGVLGGWHVNPYLIDAIIGLSVAYKAFDNLGGFRTLFGVVLDQRVMVLLFGLCHGLGLATKLQDLNPSRDGLLPNMLAFNVGVEIGQLLALALMLGFMLWWRRRPAFARHAVLANTAILSAGFLLMEFQLTGYSLDAGLLHAH